MAAPSTPLASRVFLAERYLAARADMEAHMRRGYVCLVGSRSGSAIMAFSPLSWPEGALPPVPADAAALANAPSNADLAFIRRWGFGQRPSRDVLEAHQCFRDALLCALQLHELAVQLR